MRPSPSPKPCPRRARNSGFTLIEVLVAISVMAVMAVLSWRGLDGMTQAQAQLHTRADQVLTLQAGLNQWSTDLDAVIQLPQTEPLEWDGRALRMTRRSAPSLGATGSSNAATRNASAVADEAILVVAWTRRDAGGAASAGGGGQWLRWQSPPLRSRGEVELAWAAAGQWAQNPGDDLKAREVHLSALSDWQVFFYRDDAWTNPLSSSGSTQPNAAATAGGFSSGPSALIAANVANAVASAVKTTNQATTPIPDGVRLVLTLPAGQAISGTLVKDWVRPTVGGRK